MDRRKQKTRAAIFDALISLLCEKDYADITVQQIIDRANVGRTTFYDHFETKDELVSQLCRSIFSHVFDAVQDKSHVHGDQKNAGANALMHVLHHIKEDDKKIRTLLLRDSTGTARRFFREGIESVIRSMAPNAQRKSARDCYAIDYLVSAFLDTTQWWLRKAKRLAPSEVIGLYFEASRSAFCMIFARLEPGEDASIATGSPACTRRAEPLQHAARAGR